MPIKSHYALLDKCSDDNWELYEAIQNNFERYLRQPKEKPEFEKCLEYVRKAYEFGHTFEELRDQLKFVARKSYTQSNPELINLLDSLIETTTKEIKKMKEYNFSEENIYLNTKNL